MWDLIVFIPEYCLSFYFSTPTYIIKTIKVQCSDRLNKKRTQENIGEETQKRAISQSITRPRRQNKTKETQQLHTGDTHFSWRTT